MTKRQVDWANVAAITGLKNGNTASTRFSQIKKKLGFTSTMAHVAGSSGNRVAKPRTPDKPRTSSGGRKDTPTKGATPTRARKIKTTAESYKLDTIEEGEEALTDYEDGGKQAKGKADAEARNIMAASDDEEAEEDLSMVEQVARGDFAEDGDEMYSDGMVVQEESLKPVAAGIAPKAYARSIDKDYDEYDDFEDAVYGETAAFERILNR